MRSSYTRTCLQTIFLFLLIDILHPSSRRHLLPASNNCLPRLSLYQPGISKTSHRNLRRSFTDPPNPRNNAPSLHLLLQGLLLSHHRLRRIHNINLHRNASEPFTPITVDVHRWASSTKSPRLRPGLHPLALVCAFELSNTLHTNTPTSWCDTHCRRLSYTTNMDFSLAA